MGKLSVLLGGPVLADLSGSRLCRESLSPVDPEQPDDQLRSRHSRWRKRPVAGLSVFEMLLLYLVRALSAPVSGAQQ
jgi:hypothetical protein